MVKKEEQKAVVPVNKSNEALDVPDYMKSEVGKGEGLIDTQGLKLGYVKLLQALSPEVQSNLFKSGNMLHSITQVDYGTEVEFIPLMQIKHAVRYVPRAEGGGLDCQSRNCQTGSKYEDCNSCEFFYGKFCTKKEDREKQCIIYHQYPVLVNDERLPVVIAFAMNKSTNKAGNQIANLIAGNKAQLPPYCFKFKMSVFQDKSKVGSFTFWNLRIEGAGMVEPERFAHVKKLATDLQNMKIEVAMEQESAVEDKVF